jgi:hypothetical protein
VSFQVEGSALRTCYGVVFAAVRAVHAGKPAAYVLLHIAHAAYVLLNARTSFVLLHVAQTAYVLLKRTAHVLLRIAPVFAGSIPHRPRKGWRLTAVSTLMLSLSRWLANSTCCCASRRGLQAALVGGNTHRSRQH